MTQPIAPKQTESDLTVKHPINVLQDVIARFMNIGTERVNIYNQKFKMPTDDDVFVVIGIVGARCYRARSQNLVLNSVDFGEALKLNMQEIYSIDILSKSEKAFFRKEEILMALVSQYCKSQMELYNFTISRIPSSFNDVSDVEGAARLYRFNININVLAWYYKEVAVDYYNSSLNSTQISFTQNHG